MTPSTGPTLASIIGVPSWERVWKDIPVASWPGDAIPRCRRLYRALRMSRAHLKQEHWAAYFSKSCAGCPLISDAYAMPKSWNAYVDDACCNIRYPVLGKVVDYFQSIVGLFCYKVDLRRCFSHIPLERLTNGGPTSLLGFAMVMTSSAQSNRRSPPILSSVRCIVHTVVSNGVCFNILTLAWNDKWFLKTRWPRLSQCVACGLWSGRGNIRIPSKNLACCRPHSTNTLEVS
jgi:hypothetical protein